MASHPAQLGKYQLLRRIAVGGMAEVFLGRAAGPAGFAKLVAIKRIHLHLADNPEFVEMFLDEARLAARLDHPNIVQIIDLGRVGEHYFLAMEYIHGKTLREAINRAIEHGQVLPLDGVFTIAIGVLSALGFAHSRRSANGAPAPVIHRDVSPQNILLSYSGTVKLADFGIAKAQDRVHVTQDGVIKGKAYYMAPEQMYEGKVDARVDLYSFGVVLYEMLTGRKLFGRYSQSEMFNPALNKEVPPPSQVVPARPRELDPIVLRLLERDPRRRYPSCSEVVRALEELMLATRQMASTDRLGDVMRRLFAPEQQQEESDVARVTPPPPPRGRPPPLSERSNTLPLDPAPQPDAQTFIKVAQLEAQSTSAFTNPAVRTMAILEAAGTEHAERAPAPRPITGPLERIAPDSSATVQPVTVAAEGRRPHGLPWAAIAVGGGLALLAGSIGLHAVLNGSSTPPTAQRPTTRDLAPVATTLTVLDGPLPAQDRSVRVRLRAVDAGPTRAGDPPPSRDRRPRAGTLSLTADPPGEVYLGARLLGRTPLSGVKLPAGQHTLHLRNRGLHLDLLLRVAVVAGQQVTRQVKVGSATLRVNAIPWARVFLDGRMLDVTPIKPLKIYAGQHTVELVYPAPSGEQRHRARITAREGDNLQVIHNFLKP